MPDIGITIGGDDAGLDRTLRDSGRKIDRFADEAVRDFNRIGDAANDSQNRISGRAQRGSRGGGLGAVGGRLAGAASGIFTAGAFLQVAGQATEAAREIERLNTITGLGIEQVQRYGFSLEQAGGDMADLADIVLDLSERTVLARRGNDDYIEAFRTFGITAAEVESLGVPELFERINQAVAEGNPTIEERQALMELLGDETARTVLATKGFTDGQALIVQQSPQAVESLSAIGRAFDNIGTSAVNAFANWIGSFVGPFLTSTTQVVDAAEDVAVALAGIGVSGALAIVLAQQGLTPAYTALRLAGSPAGQTDYERILDPASGRPVPRVGPPLSDAGRAAQNTAVALQGGGTRVPNPFNTSAAFADVLGSARDDLAAIAETLRSQVRGRGGTRVNQITVVTNAAGSIICEQDLEQTIERNVNNAIRLSRIELSRDCA